jgi:hypothetical protein
MNKTKTPVMKVFLITDAEPIQGHPRCKQPGLQQVAPDKKQKRGDNKAAIGSRHCASIQKCPELIPAPPEGANDGRAKWASGEYVPGSVDSVTTPSSLDEAQAESRHPITKEITPHKTARFSTEANVPIAQPDATLPS